MPRTHGRLDGGTSSLLPEQVIKEPPAELHRRDLLYRRAPHWAPRHAAPIKVLSLILQKSTSGFLSLLSLSQTLLYLLRLNVTSREAGLLCHLALNPCHLHSHHKAAFKGIVLLLSCFFFLAVLHKRMTVLFNRANSDHRLTNSQKDCINHATSSLYYKYRNDSLLSCTLTYSVVTPPVTRLESFTDAVHYFHAWLLYCALQWRHKMDGKKILVTF